jgi:cephalosporin-C deacetylase
MARTDLPLSELVEFRPDVREPADFDAFWEHTLAETRRHDLDIQLAEVATPFVTVGVHDLQFAGYGGDRIGAWLTIPRHIEGPLPAVVEFIGYGGGRSLPGDSLAWASAGYAHLLMDTRGQGRWSAGDTPDPHGSGPSMPGFMTKGIQDRETYYYRRVFTDAVRAVEAVRTVPGVDPSRVAVQGVSQGGGITLAAGGLVPDLVAAMPDVPFLCHFERAVDICTEHPFLELTQYLAVQRDQAERVFDTLSYFDAVNFAKRGRAPAFFSVALMDQICPPSTVYAAFNHYQAEKKVVNYAYNDHEGGQSQQKQAQIRWLNGLLA